MSNVEENQNEPYRSEVDPAFSQAWNSVFNPQDASAEVEGGDEATPAGGSTPSSAPAPEGAGTESGDAQPSRDGARPEDLPSAGDISRTRDAAAATPGEGHPAPEGGTEGSESAPDAGGSTGRTGLDPAEISTALGSANEKVSERLETAVLGQVTREVYDSIDKEFHEVMRLSPFEIVGSEVPDLRRGAQEGSKIKLRDSAEAREYQDSLKNIVQRQVDDQKQQKLSELKPMMSMVQGSVMLFQNNPDLVPGSAKFDVELATRFTRMAKAYEQRGPNGKLLGYAVNVQPMINELRSGLNSERGAQGQQRSEQQRQAAANQPRTEQGRFDSPQGGIMSKSNAQGGGGAEEEFSTFWSAVGIQNPGLKI